MPEATTFRLFKGVGNTISFTRLFLIGGHKKNYDSTLILLERSVTTSSQHAGTDLPQRLMINSLTLI